MGRKTGVEQESRNRRTTGWSTWLFLFFAALAFWEVPASAGDTIRVSVDSAGNQGNTESNNPSISANGRYVAFDSKD
jgi:hypothetical protein